MKAEDWTGVDSDADGIPDWWIWQYFGNLSETATNLDSQGNTLGYDFANGLDPNVIAFSVSVGSQVPELQSRAGATERFGGRSIGHGCFGGLDQL